MLSSAKQLPGFLKMEVVWRAEMDDLNGLVGGKFFERAVSARKSERVGSRFGSFGSAAENAANGHSEASKSVEVSASDKTQSSNGGSDLHVSS
jgi:hypothetical protein